MGENGVFGVVTKPRYISLTSLLGGLLQDIRKKQFMHNIQNTIREMLLEGQHPQYIAKVLDIPRQFVYDVMTDMAEYAENFEGNVEET